MFTPRPMPVCVERPVSRLTSCCAAAAIGFAALVAEVPRAGAGSRGIGIGIGTGLSILNGLQSGAHGGSSSHRKQSGDVGTQRKSRHTAHRSHDNDDDDDAKSKKSKSAATENAKSEPGVADQSVETGTKDGSKEKAGDEGKAPDTATIDPNPGSPQGEQAPPRSPASAKISTPAEITAAQEHLRYLGYDVATSSGQLDLQTKIAIMKFQDSVGAPATGELTVEQLQRLFVMASEKSAHK
jgi:Putative peptidoglycan binding domain